MMCSGERGTTYIHPCFRLGFCGAVAGSAILKRKVASSIPDDQRLFTPLARLRRQSLPGWPPGLV